MDVTALIEIERSLDNCEAERKFCGSVLIAEPFTGVSSISQDDIKARHARSREHLKVNDDKSPAGHVGAQHH